jgi:TPR repeat protein
MAPKAASVQASKRLKSRLPRSIALVLALAISMNARADLATAEAAYQRKDYDTAFQEFKALAEQGDSTAQSSLGILYELGKGVAKDYALAARWYTLSAEQGNDNGQYNLATMYYQGSGVPKDIVTACTWWSIATRSNNGAARNSMQLCLRHLDEKGRSQYERRVEEWLAAHPPK